MSAVWTVVGVNKDASDIVTSMLYTVHQGNIALSGEVRLDPPTETPIPFSELTHQQVLTWLWRYVNKDATEAVLAARAAEQPAETLPWS